MANVTAAAKARTLSGNSVRTATSPTEPRSSLNSSRPSAATRERMVPLKPASVAAFPESVCARARSSSATRSTIARSAAEAASSDS
jgi:hypothetical protein